MKTKLFYFVLLTGLIFLVFFPGKIIAQADLLSIDVDVKVASMKGEKIFKTPSSVTVINKEQIEAFGFTSVAEALRSVAGMDVIRTYLKRNLPTSRGILQDHYANKVLVLINNIPTWNAVTGEGIIDRINIHDIERIEVLKGPASILYGTNAYSGAINIVLKESKETHVQSYGGIGSNGSFNGGANVTATSGDLSIFASANSSDEYQAPGMWMGEDSTKAMVNERMLWDNFNLHMKYKSHSFLVNGYNGQESYLGVEPKHSSGTNNSHIAKGYLVNYTFNQTFKEKTDVIFSLNYDYGLRNLSRTKLDNVRANIEGYRYGGTLKLTHTISDMISVEGGIDYDQRFSKEYANYEVFVDTVQDENNMKERKIYEGSGYAQVNFTSGNFTALAGARYTNNELFGGNLSPRATLVYSLNEKNSVKLIYGESYRAPSLFELYFMTSGKTVFGNEKLDPEKSRSFELAYLTSFNKFFIQVLAYHGIYQNKIYRSSDTTLVLPDGSLNTAGKPVYTNGNEFTANGVEFELKYNNPEIINAFLNVNILMGNDEDKDSKDNYNFKYVPGESITLGLSKEIKKFGVSAVYHYWGETEGPFAKIDAQSLLDAQLSFKHNVDKLKFSHSISFKNLLDEDIVYAEYARRSATAKNHLNSVPWGYGQMIMYSLSVTF